METNKNNKHSRQERGHQMTLVFRQSTRHRKEKKKVSRGIKIFRVARTVKGPRGPGWRWPGCGDCQTPCGRQEPGTRYPPGSSLWAERNICFITTEQLNIYSFSRLTKLLMLTCCCEAVRVCSDVTSWRSSLQSSSGSSPDITSRWTH